VKHFDGAVETLDVAAAFFPDLDAAGVDELHAITLGRREQPGDIGTKLFRLVSGDLIQDVMIVPDKDEEPLVDDGRIVELFVRVPCAERRDRGVKGGRVA